MIYTVYNLINLIFLVVLTSLINSKFSEGGGLHLLIIVPLQSSKNIQLRIGVQQINNSMNELMKEYIFLHVQQALISIFLEAVSPKGKWFRQNRRHLSSKNPFH